tara:strand:- start:47 stop:838 length:792 start_codon:yes stop_codon:yes gene_type:complete
MECKYPYNSNNESITKDTIHKILSSLKITFEVNNLSLYQKSFIHESYRKLKCYENMVNKNNNMALQEESYERLEFIGDALIESITANYLYDRYHIIYKQDEGFLTKLKTRLVCGKNLTYLSGCLELQKYIVISKMVEDKNKGRENMKSHKILCDVFEAFCGALYQDTNDYELVKKFIINVYEKFIDFSELIITDINYKDKLSRYIKKTYDNYPIYNTIMIDEDNYKTEIFNGEDKIGEFISLDKKDSNQEAAKLGLIYYGILN